MSTEAKEKEAKSPVESAANQLREAFTKEWQGKLKEQLSKSLASRRVATNEESALRALVEQYEAEKADFNESVKELA